MQTHRKLSSITTLILLLAFMQSCGTALQPAATTGTILYTQGLRQDTAMLQIDLPPADVYYALVKVVANRPDLKMLNKNEQRFLIEIEKDGQFLSAQATSLDDNQTLLFLWADAGKSDRTGHDLTRSATEEICKQLAVRCIRK